MFCFGQLFRAIATVPRVIAMWRRNVRVKKQGTKDEESSDLADMLMVYEQRIEHWLAKTCKVPLASVTASANLNLDPQGGGLQGASIVKALFGGLGKKGRAAARARKPKYRMMQLKVRLRAIVQALVKEAENGKVPEKIMIFLSRLMQDGNYFPPRFLFAREREVLDFAPGGATRWMLPFADHDPYRAKLDARIAHNAKEDAKAKARPPHISFIPPCSLFFLHARAYSRVLSAFVPCVRVVPPGFDS